MSKQRWLLTGAVGLGLLSAQACGNDTATHSSSQASSPDSAIVLGGGGALDHAGSGDQAAVDPLAAGEANESAGQAGESEAGSAGTAGSSDRDGAAGETSGGTSGAMSGGTGANTNGGTAGATAGATNGEGATGGVEISEAGRGVTAGNGGGPAIVGHAFTVQATDFGDVLATSSGRTLYVYAMSSPAPEAPTPVRCDEGPYDRSQLIYYSTSLAAPPGLLTSDFGTVDCPNGVQQSTYKGWPLYISALDRSAGDINGETSYVSVVLLPFTRPGIVQFSVRSVVGCSTCLTIGTKSGAALYVHHTDTAGTATTAPVSSCNDDCLKTWPLYYVDQVSTAFGLKASDFGSFDRGGNVMQSTYRGWPLYTYAADSAYADAKGEGIDGEWYTESVQ